jgi:hypothetical protein
MVSYRSGTVAIEMEQHEPPATASARPGILVLHGSGGAGSYWMDRFAPTLTKFGVAAYAPHYLQKTRSQRATAEMILDGKHFPEWLGAIRGAVSYIAERPGDRTDNVAHDGLNRRSARRALLKITGNCRGFALIRSTALPMSARRRRPNPGTSRSYRSRALPPGPAKPRWTCVWLSRALVSQSVDFSVGRR